MIFPRDTDVRIFALYTRSSSCGANHLVIQNQYPLHILEWRCCCFFNYLEGVSASHFWGFVPSQVECSWFLGHFFLYDRCFCSVLFGLLHC